MHMKMKKILMIGTHPDTMGGISSVINVYRDGGVFDRYPVEYLATHRDGGAATKLKTFAGALFRFAWLLLSGQVSLIHVHTASRASFWRKCLFMLGARLFGVPSILHLHGAEFHVFYEKENGAFGQRLIRSTFAHASRVIVLSDTWRRWIEGVCPQAKVSVIYNPVLVPQPAPAWNLRTPGRTLFFGRVGPRKGTYDLLAAAATLHGEPALSLYFGGDGEVDKASARAAELGVAQKVRFLGWVRGDAKRQALNDAMIYALPSYNEGLPMSVLEAMAAGLPILTTPVGGIPEAVSDGVEGFLVEPGDVPALAARWRQLLDDEALARRMGEAARRKVETSFSAEAILPQVERLYDSLGAIRS
jgi:glycosyltransferase involved in cell wall biosynthesis